MTIYTLTRDVDDAIDYGHKVIKFKKGDEVTFDEGRLLLTSLTPERFAELQHACKNCLVRVPTPAKGDKDKGDNTPAFYTDRLAYVKEITRKREKEMINSGYFEAKGDKDEPQGKRGRPANGDVKAEKPLNNKAEKPLSNKSQ